VLKLATAGLRSASATSERKRWRWYLRDASKPLTTLGGCIREASRMLARRLNIAPLGERGGRVAAVCEQPVRVTVHGRGSSLLAMGRALRGRNGDARPLL
jgi:hypothetical protein